MEITIKKKKKKFWKYFFDTEASRHLRPLKAAKDKTHVWLKSSEVDCGGKEGEKRFHWFKNCIWVWPNMLLWKLQLVLSGFCLVFISAVNQWKYQNSFTHFIHIWQLKTWRYEWKYDPSDPFQVESCTRTHRCHHATFYRTTSTKISPHPLHSLTQQSTLTHTKHLTTLTYCLQTDFKIELLRDSCVLLEADWPIRSACI